MYSVLRTYLAVALALMLALTGQSMAVARGTPGPVGQVALCTGSGPVMVFVDENGVPTGPPVLCPDFALNLLAAVATPDPMVVPVFRITAVRPLVSGSLRGIRPYRRPMARAPPHVV